MAPSISRSRITVDTSGSWRLYWGNNPLPAGTAALGTVTVGHETGALLVTPAGYAVGNARALRQLDPRKTRAAILTAGGEPPALPTGPKPADGASGVIRKNVTLDQPSIDKLRTLGDGDLSLGIRRAAAKL